MTKNKPNPHFLNIKIYVDGHSEAIQKKLFELGIRWHVVDEERVLYIDSPFLFVDENGRMSKSNSMTTFQSSEYREVTSEYILGLKRAKKFEPKTLQPFENVLARDTNDEQWIITLYGYKLYTEDGNNNGVSCSNGAVFRY